MNLKTLDLIGQTYWFPGMRELVKDYIASCIKCLIYSIPIGKGQLHIYEKDTRSFETLHIDHYDPFEKTGGGLNIFLL